MSEYDKSLNADVARHCAEPKGDDHTVCDGCGWECYEEEVHKNVLGARLCRECIASENNMSVGGLIAFLGGSHE